MDKQSKKTNKYAAVITYVIAVICLLLGLFLPLTGGKEILALQLPEAFNAVSGGQSGFILAYPIDFLGLGFTVDIMAWVILIYAVITALGVIALIPVLACKKHSRAANVFAYFIEVIALAVLSVYLIIALQRYPSVAFDYNLLIAFGGTLLMLILQCLIYKKGAGAAKVILFLLSAVALIALFDFTVLFTFMHSTWANIADALKSSTVLYSDNTGIGFIRLLFEGNGGNGLLNAVNSAAAVKEKTAIMLAAIVAGLAVLNFFIDLIALSTNGRKAGYGFNNFRYVLELLAVISLYITLAFCKVAPGLLLYVLTLALVIQIIISIVRAVKYGKHREKAKLYKDEKPVPSAFESDEDNSSALPYIPAPVIPAPVIPAPESEPFAAPAPAYDTQSAASRTSEPIQPQVYKVSAVYQGPADDFMRKLTNDEKIEFAMTFIEKSKGDLGNIPDYVIGGNNKKFFSSVFIYLGKVRSLISDGLLNKMYKELNTL